MWLFRRILLAAIPDPIHLYNPPPQYIQKSKQRTYQPPPRASPPPAPVVHETRIVRAPTTPPPPQPSWLPEKGSEDALPDVRAKLRAMEKRVSELRDETLRAHSIQVTVVRFQHGVSPPVHFWLALQREALARVS